MQKRTAVLLCKNKLIILIELFQQYFTRADPQRGSNMYSQKRTQ